MDTSSPAGSVFRIDKFIVPAAARAEFLRVAQDTQAFLTAQPGCRQNLILEQISDPGTFKVVTIAEWASAAAFEAAGAAIGQWRQTTGFDTAAFVQRHGIKPDMGNYRVLAPLDTGDGNPDA